MSPNASRAGKTAARLLEDLLSLDPRTASVGKNVLADPAPIYDDPRDYVPRLPQNSCRHLYTINHPQSVIPPLDTRAEPGATWRIASVCQNCRCHLTLTIHFEGGSGATSLCPNVEHPLHFLVLQSRREPQESWISENLSCKAREREYCFQCTSPTCSATVWINLSPPRLTSERINLLSGPSNLRLRYDAAVAADPSRSFEEANSALALYRLRTYLRDSLDPKSNRSHFPQKNKFFIATFGRDCDEYLRSLGFSDEDDPEEGPIWRIPRPYPQGDAFDQTSHRALLEDLIEELSILTIKRPLIERQAVKNLVHQPLQARRDLERMLGMLDYEKTATSRRYDPNTAEHPYYASLGAVADFSDNLILYSYDRQVECDVENSPYYFECLQDLATGRNSETLQTKVATLASQDQISRKDVAKAYRYFGINEKHLEIVTDEHILGLFQSRLPDIGPSQESEMREMLRTLARVRNSELLSHAASDTIETYNQALSWLGAEESTADDFIPTLFKMKVDENAALRETAEKAVKLIAMKRKSEALENYLVTGEMSTPGLDPAEAYRTLDIPDRALDDELIINVYETRVQDAPKRENLFFVALTAIAKDRGSRRLTGYVGFGQHFLASPIAPSVHESPVGLHNLAVTCYLNSVLQLFFSIKPFREIVMNFEEWKTDVTSVSLQNKRVGSAIRTIEEVELSQQFTYALANLFRTMVHANTRVAKYDTEFAGLALIILSKDLMTRRRSTVSGDQPDLAEYVQNEHLLRSVPETEHDGSQRDLIAQVADSQSSSQDTLIDNSLAAPAEDEELKDMNMTDIEAVQAGTPKGLSTDHSVQNQVSDSVTTDAGNADERTKHPNTPDVTDDEMLMKETISKDEDNASLHVSSAAETTTETTTTANYPPSRAAPKPELPPRQKKARQEKESPGVSRIAAVEDTAKQQDAAEVTDNMLAKVRIAIKASGFDDNGEQLDPIRDLLFGMQRNVIIRPDGQKTTNIEMLDNIRLPLPGPLHIYQALDNYFDIQEKVLDGVTVQGHASIDSAPPVLGLQIGRIEWDATKLMATKTEHHLELEDVIYIDRYLTSDKVDQMKHDRWLLKKEKAALQAERDALMDYRGRLNASAVMMGLSDLVRSVKGSVDDEGSGVPSVEDELTNSLYLKADELGNAMYVKDREINKVSQDIHTHYKHMKSVPYRLYALCMHRGNVGFGHYWIYINDFANGVWRKYNDDMVEVVKDPEEEIFEDPTGQPPVPTPHYIIYVRDEHKESLTQPLCRKPDDVEMEG